MFVFPKASIINIIIMLYNGLDCLGCTTTCQKTKGTRCCCESDPKQTQCTIDGGQTQSARWTTASDLNYVYIKRKPAARFTSAFKALCIITITYDSDELMNARTNQRRSDESSLKRRSFITHSLLSFCTKHVL